MTDPSVADVIYLEPLTVEAVEAVIARERPEGLLAGLGGQTALNLTAALADAGVFERHADPPARHAARGDPDGRGSRGVPRPARPDRPAVRAERDRRGTDAGGARRLGRRGPRGRSACRPSSGPAFTLGGTGGGIVETEPAYRERIRAGLRASPIGQVMVERCLVGWQEIEYEVMRDADDTCIAVCSMENVDPLGVHTGDSIVVAPVQTLTDAVHQRLRSAALAIIRALGVEGGCNVQFALSPDSTEYAVIEVNPRVSRSSALASKATGYPIARVAAQIAIGRRLAEIPNVVTGTTVAAFEPALDYVVVKLPRFPFDKFPGADRTLGSQMKATGEVMAIDRTFGSALNKALRGLEQAGVGPLAEDPAWRSALDYLAGGLRRRPRRRRADPLGRRGRAGVRIDPPRPADRRADRAAPLPRAVRQPAVADPRAAAAGRARGGHPRGDRDRGLVPRARWAATSRSRRRSPRPARGWPIRAIAAAAELLATVKRAGFGDRELADLAGTTPDEIRAARLVLGLRPGYAMVDTCAAEFAAETPYFYSTYAAAGSAPEAPPVDAAGGAGHRLGAGPDRAGDRVRLLRGPGGRHAPAGGLERGDDQLEPGDRLDRLRRVVAAVLRAARPGERPQRDRRRDARRRDAPAGGRRVRRPDAAQPGRAAGRRRRAAARLGPRGDRPGRGADALLGAARPARHPAAGGRHGPQRRGGADARRADRLPGHRPAVVRHRRAGHRLLLLARRTWPASWPPRPSSTPIGRSGSTATSRASRSTSTPCRTASAC